MFKRPRIAPPRRGQRFLGAVALTLALSLLAAACVPRPGGGTHQDPLTTPSNTDSSQFHLLWYGRREAPPDKIDPMSLLTQGYNPFAVTTGIIKLVALAEGGTKTIIERYAGYCRDVPETYAKVRVRTSGLSSSADLIWEATSRAEPAYIRYLFDTYRGRRPSCNELREYVGWIEPLWNTWNRRALLNEFACDPRAKELASEQALLDFFCALESSTNETIKWRMFYAHELAAASAERCTTTTLVNHEVKRHRIMISNLKGGDLNDIKAAIGRPQKFKDLSKVVDGRMVTHETVLSAYKYVKDLFFTNGIPNEPLPSVASVADDICKSAGQWIQEPNAWVALMESDRVFRDFVDQASGVALGTNLLAESTRANLWTEFVKLTKLSPPCDQDWRDGQDNGRVCQQGSAAWTIVSSLL